MSRGPRFIAKLLGLLRIAEIATIECSLLVLAFQGNELVNQRAGASGQSVIRTLESPQVRMFGLVCRQVFPLRHILAKASAHVIHGSMDGLRVRCGLWCAR